MSAAKRSVLLCGLAIASLAPVGCESDGGPSTEISTDNVDSEGGAEPGTNTSGDDGEAPSDGDAGNSGGSGGSDAGSKPDAGPKPEETPKVDFVMQLLHAADMEAGAAAVQDAPRFSAVLEALRGKYENQTLTLASGDTWIPGPFYTVSGEKALAEGLGIPKPGRTDVLMLNAMGFQASAFGNHEFDLSPASVASLLAPEQGADVDMNGMPDTTYPGAAFPYLSANLVFTTNANLAPLYVSELTPAVGLAAKIAPSTFIEIDGQTIGIVAATTPTLGSISSPGSVGVLPKDAEDLDALAVIIQAQIDVLSARGIDKIVLLAHMQQIAIEQALAAKLRDVDIIVAGGSNTLLADMTDRLRVGDTAAGPYPIMLRTQSNQPVAIVNTDGNYRYVGRLVVGFDKAGLLVESSINPDESGAYATDSAGVLSLGGAQPNAVVEKLAENLGKVLNVRDGNLFGASSVYLDGRRSKVRTEQTNLGDLTADANLFVAAQHDATVSVSIKNGGGIRSEIGVVTFPAGSTNPEDVLYLPTAENPAAGKQRGDISQFDIENALSFNNALALVSLTAEELERLLEHGVAGVAPGSTPGQFFQIGGMRVSFDPSREAQKYDVDRKLVQVGNRIRNAAIIDAQGNVIDALVRDGKVEGDPTRLIRVVTLSFLADGGDGYPFPVGGGQGRVELAKTLTLPGSATFAAPGTEQDALAEYLVARTTRSMPFQTAEVEALNDDRIHNLAIKPADQVFPTVP